jgi:hypothetical protein
MPGYAGLVPLNSAISKVVVSKNASSVPTDADALPTYRIYSVSGFLLSGSLGLLDSTAITGATNASPTVITSVGHGLDTGVKVTIANVGGNTGANGTWDITKIDSNRFSIAVDTSAGSAYTSGGTWHSTGLYNFTITPTIGLNFLSGSIYSVAVYCKISTVVNILEEFEFQVT